MKNIVMAIFATLMFTGCLFSKKEEAAPEAAPAAAEQAAPAADQAAPAPAAEPAPAE